MPLNQSLKGKEYGEISFTVDRDRVVQFADASLNALVSRIRGALARAPDGGAELRGATGSYSLVLPADAFVDRERAWSAIHHVQAIRRAGRAAVQVPPPAVSLVSSVFRRAGLVDFSPEQIQFLERMQKLLRQARDLFVPGALL